MRNRLSRCFLMCLLSLSSCIIDDDISHTINFETGEGASIVDGQQVEDGKTATVPEDPTKEGHTFAGWYTEDTFEGLFDFTTAITDHATLYAKWEAITYTVIFETGEDASAMDDQTVVYGATVTKPEDPTRDSSVFTGWYTDHTLITNLTLKRP